MCMGNFDFLKILMLLEISALSLLSNRLFANQMLLNVILCTYVKLL